MPKTARNRPAGEEAADGPDLVRCRLQQAPSHRLANLTNIPVLLVTAEASYHSVYDHCTVKYLSQAGVKVTAMPLADHGVHGNGHMVMIEKSNSQIAALLADWLSHSVADH